MLVHPASKPCSPIVDEEEADAIQAAFTWTIQKTADMIQPNAYILGWIFTAG